ncbi:hypothetical protein B296_00025352 [Ensete ventricosum]|uniref:Uncharacterized protein n=1 Tax=Ensete ventricosum TaxID=4639 RepID=A0A427AI41_ENSVE|nr:hypothetical protein B296_00025352 [Ensete ventricosum]
MRGGGEDTACSSFPPPYENQLGRKISSAIAKLLIKGKEAFPSPPPPSSVAVAALGPAVEGDAPLPGRPTAAPPPLAVASRAASAPLPTVAAIRSQFLSPAFHEDGPISSPVYSPSLRP